MRPGDGKATAILCDDRAACCEPSPQLMVAVKSLAVAWAMKRSVNVATAHNPCGSAFGAVDSQAGCDLGPTATVTVLVATADVVRELLTVQSMVWLVPIWLVVLKVIEFERGLVLL